MIAFIMKFVPAPYSYLSLLSWYFEVLRRFYLWPTTSRMQYLTVFGLGSTLAFNWWRRRTPQLAVTTQSSQKRLLFGGRSKLLFSSDARIHYYKAIIRDFRHIVE